MKPLKLPCYCGSIRQASRFMTQIYDHALKPSGLKITQFSILKLLSTSPGLTTGDMAQGLVMDSTTLTRTLKIMQDSEWIDVLPGVDRRERHWNITKIGLNRLDQALPLWKSAQKELKQLAGDTDLDKLSKAVFQIVQKTTLHNDRDRISS